jgi:hypothetical protein
MEKIQNFVLNILNSIALWVVSIWVPADRRLEGYHQPTSGTWHRLRRRIILSLIAFVGMIYGFLVAIFPLAFYTYLAMPIAFVILLVVWALPETDSAPRNLMINIFFVFFASLLLWPMYLAITFPGLPWITLVRLWSVPLIILFLVSFSISPRFRRELYEPLMTSPWFIRLIGVFVAIQILTIPFSPHAGDALNKVIDSLLTWSGMFFVSLFVFLQPGRAMKWATWFVAMALPLCVIGQFEYIQQHVLWAGHIPSFLTVQDETVQRILAGGGRLDNDIHRVQSTFVTSLNFAEFLALITPFTIYFILQQKNIFARAVLVAFLGFVFWIILATDSRIGSAGFFISCLLYSLAWMTTRWRTMKQDMFAPALAIAYPIGLAFFIFLSLTWPRLLNMTWGSGAKQYSTDARKAQLGMMWEDLGRNPFGYGMGSSGEVLGYTNLAGTMTVDSYFIVTALDFGVIGFFAFFGVILYASYRCIKYGIDLTEGEETLLVPLGIALFVFVVGRSVLGQGESTPLMFMMLGMAAALIHRASKDRRAPLLSMRALLSKG